MSVFEKPRWLRDLLRFLPLKSQFVLSGNIQDLQVQEVVTGSLAAVNLQASLAIELYRRGYEHVLAFDTVRGVRLFSKNGSVQSADSVLQQLRLAEIQELPSSAERAHAAVNAVTSYEGPPVTIIMDFASRLTVRNDSLSPGEHTLFSRALVSSLSAKPRPHGVNSQPFFNTLIWVVDKEGDLPDWLTLGNPAIRHIPIPKPDHIQRRAIVPSLLRAFPQASQLSETELNNSMSVFVDQTEGLLLMDLNAIMQLSRSEGVSAKQVSDAVRRYKVGVTEDQWQKIDREKVRNAMPIVQARVKGQDHAVTHMLDIMKRSVTGVGAPRRGGRPRGVVFLAGPSGVGKTEMAKTITRLLFGDESAYIRFDMSEFSAEHSDQRLIGAPPGYVGYDVGGELTNAIREKPFSVVLFDEIEKAHPRILDKFLQVLDDGVLTSGRGDRVYFSESFIIFTSNLGIYRTDATGNRVLNVAATDSFDDVRTKVRTEIDRYFKVVLNRPEILNRIGENVIVFDFIRPEFAAQILRQMVDETLRDLADTQIQVSLDDVAFQKLSNLCLSDLSNGGRGIRNQVELHLVNPLARALFDCEANPGSSWIIVDMTQEATTELVMKRRDNGT
ncbi:AAA domain-containing protein [bacterium]|nr:AAA domain-containing protein [bacterium]